MSRENVESIRGLMAAYERGDFDTVYAGYDPAIEWRVGRLPIGQLGFEPVYHGVDGVRRMFRQWVESWQTIAFEFHEYVDAGDQVVVVLSQRVRGRTSEVEVEMREYAQVWTLRDGLVVRSEFFPTRAEALAAVDY